MSEPRKAVVSVTDMARMVGLSRQRFGQLVKSGIFPAPDHDPTTGRPFYDSIKQQECLLVRQTNTGINGKPILFYARRCDTGIKKASSRRSKPKQSTNTLMDHLAQLGVQVSAQQVEAAIKIVFPDGLETIDFDHQVRGLFLHFRRKNKADSGGR